jgi:serine protease Do
MIAHHSAPPAFVRTFVTLLTAASLGGTAAAQESSGKTVSPQPQAGADMPVERLESLKDATVYVKAAKGYARGIGSGFVIEAEGNDGLVVTNEHVVNPTIRVERRTNGRQVGPTSVYTSAEPSAITLVFWSGTNKEASVSGEVLYADPKLDLAVVKFKGLSRMPAAIDYLHTPKVTETMQIFVFGFPFGAVLALGNPNPAVTVGKGMVSGLRRDKQNELNTVLIDGALNPGNSGGPVVDSAGRLVGVAAKTIRGSHIGLAIPTIKLMKVLTAKTGDVHLTARKLTVDGKGGVAIDVRTELVDPAKNIKELSLLYLPTAAYKNRLSPGADGGWPPLPEAQQLKLSVTKGTASGPIPVDENQVVATELVVQTACKLSDGKTVYGQPVTCPVLNRNRLAPAQVRPSTELSKTKSPTHQ